MSRYESLRASDTDRDAVTERLREAAGEGRLEPDELEERVDSALRARTYGELAPLVADLGRPPNTPWRRPGGRTRAVARSALPGAAPGAPPAANRPALTVRGAPRARPAVATVSPRRRGAGPRTVRRTPRW